MAECAASIRCCSSALGSDDCVKELCREREIGEEMNNRMTDKEGRGSERFHSLVHKRRSEGGQVRMLARRLHHGDEIGIASDQIVHAFPRMTDCITEVRR